MTTPVTALLIFLLASGLTACHVGKTKRPKALLGTWREGFVAARRDALSHESWNTLWEWANEGARRTVAPVRRGESVDLMGEAHAYIDTRAAGRRDACIGLVHEMRFIQTHNSGDLTRLYEIMSGWMRRQNPEQIIPPGHF